MNGFEPFVWLCFQLLLVSSLSPLRFLSFLSDCSSSPDSTYSSSCLPLLRRHSHVNLCGDGGCLNPDASSTSQRGPWLYDHDDDPRDSYPVGGGHSGGRYRTQELGYEREYEDEEDEDEDAENEQDWMNRKSVIQFENVGDDDELDREVSLE